MTKTVPELKNACPTRRIPVAPVEQGIYRSQRLPCPGCGKIVTAHPNGMLPRHHPPSE